MNRSFFETPLRMLLATIIVGASGLHAQETSSESDAASSVLKSPEKPDIEATDIKVVSKASRDQEAKSDSNDEIVLRATVRVRLKGKSSGTGTIIDSDEKDSTILTCWHLFREAGVNAVVEIDRFPIVDSGEEESFTGHCIAFDERADLALMRISPGKHLPSVQMGRELPQIVKTDRLMRTGRSPRGGLLRVDVEVIAVNRYDGPDNLVCTGFPEPGQSGCGLFRDGELVGVCIAADPVNSCGVFTGIRPILSLLKNASANNDFPMSLDFAATGNSEPDKSVQIAIESGSPNVPSMTQRSPSSANLNVVIRLRHSSAKECAEVMEKLFPRPQSLFVPEQKNNSLLVSSVPELMGQIGLRVREFDESKSAGRTHEQPAASKSDPKEAINADRSESKSDDKRALASKKKLTRSQDDLKVVEGQSQLFETDSNVVRMQIANPLTIDVVQFSGKEFSIVGKAGGTTTLTLWLEGESEPLVNTVQNDSQFVREKRYSNYVFR